MSPRTKNLLLAGGAAALLGIIAVNVLVSPPAAAPADAAATVASEGEGVAPVESSSPGGVASAVEHARVGADASGDASPAEGALSGAALASPQPATPGAGLGAAAPARRSYAIRLHDLQGLPPDAAPGTAFELWVTWEPPVTEEPRLHRLIGDVVLERTIPGAVPEAPVTVLVSVPADRAGDLIYADTFGRLSVVLPG
ncbi:MAG: hypothetical protein ABR613_03625 [Actinomycetota bacterium]